MVRCVFLLLWLMTPALVQAQVEFSYREAPLPEVIDDLGERTGYRFLYRDALVAGTTVTFEAAPATWSDAFCEALRRGGLDARVDAERRQVLIFEAASSERAPTTLRGAVLDAESGARLPFATVTWTHDGYVRGVTTNEAGAFQIALDEAWAARGTLDLSASYVGFESGRVRVDLEHGADLAIRLQPRQTLGREVVVTGTALRSNLDTTWQRVVRPRAYAPFGEASVIRSLQALPSVAVTPALSQGINVRGSGADGFQVLLDGITIYNQQHFFGLFDAFNADALQTVGLYYDVAPADLFAPPGGTLAFMTRTGSQTSYHGRLGSSSTALRGTVEGPLRPGRTSVIVSGRYADLGGFGWPSSNDLIAFGLDIDRLHEDLPGASQDVEDRVVRPGMASARFYDVHAKVYDEAPGGRRLIVSGYVGGNTTEQTAERLVGIDTARPQGQRRIQEVETRNRWSNEAATAQLQHALGSRLYHHLTVGVSRYRSRYEKDDFNYGLNILTFAPFANHNDLLELKLGQTLDLAPQSGGAWSLGYALHYFDVTYEEDSARRQDFSLIGAAVQFDGFVQYDAAPVEAIAVQAGVRSHFFSEGSYLRLSPRLRLGLWPQRPVSASIGFSRNYQFLHQVHLQNTTSANVWIIATGEEAPASVDNLTAGLYLHPTSTTALQIEGYVKRHDNMRWHETNAGPERLVDARQTPWFFDNEALARGIEVMVRQRFRGVDWTTSYTLARVEVQHERFNGGEPFLPEWDRTHQLTTHLDVALHPRLSVHAGWMFASGAPNVLAYTDPGEPDHLRDYHRLDAGLTYRQRIGRIGLEAGVAAYNLYDRQNTWYRETMEIVARQPLRLVPVNVDVYDLGFRPSFDVALSF